jgi:hypothetical protein
MVEPVRHRRTKGAATDMFEPKATASHLDSTQSGRSYASSISLPRFEPTSRPSRMFRDQTRFRNWRLRMCSPGKIPSRNSTRNQRAAYARNCRDPRRFCASASLYLASLAVSFTSTHFRTLTLRNLILWRTRHDSNVWPLLSEGNALSS